MSRRQTDELPNIMKLGTKAPIRKKDEIPHWKVWAWAKRNAGIPWRRSA